MDNLPHRDFVPILTAVLIQSLPEIRKIATVLAWAGKTRETPVKTGKRIRDYTVLSRE
jgi:hypothetical protein